MYALKVVASARDFDRFIKDHLREEDARRFNGCEWVPVRIALTDLLEIEVTAVPTAIPVEVDSL